ncbi:MAG: radical SAM protein [bacterium]|jgi:radical SAM protein with 4Fe4S-binding SPASM domain|nr:radical SAM protein [candidate division KSB1 bacterium]MDH7559968.1 radical SAM protein [bacterium]
MKEVVPRNLLRALSPWRVYNVALATGSYVASLAGRRPLVWAEPAILMVEPTNRCNLRCPQCHTGSGRINRPYARLSPQQFRAIIDELGESLVYLLLFNQGEPYLHPEFLDLVEYAKSRRIYVTTSTNGHFFDAPQVVERTVTSGLDTLVVSLDGADKETYLRYRCGGDFEKVTQGVRNIVAARRRLKSPTPLVFVQFLLLRHNEHQLQEICSLAKELGADRVLLKTAQVETPAEAEQFLPRQERYRRYRIDQGRLLIKGSRRLPCRRPWFSTVVNSDGRVSPCCFDKDGRYAVGNIAEAPLRAIWRSPEYNDFRERILHGEDIDICRTCTEGTRVFV